MRKRIYWVLATALTALVVHLSFVLFAPQLTMAEKLEDIQKSTEGKSLVVLDRAESLRLLGQESDWMVHALCTFDLTQGTLLIKAVIPPSYWSISVYSANGDNFYTFNDRQADVASLAILVEPARVPVSDTEAPEGDALAISAPEPRGFVVMRALAPNGPDYERIAQVLGRSSCTLSQH